MSSNMIKAYTITYDKERVCKLDMKTREKQIAEHLRELIPEERFFSAVLPEATADENTGAFVPGIAAEDVSGYLPEEPQAAMPEQELEVLREQLREELRAEIQLEMEASIRKQTEEANSQAKKQAEELLAKAKQEAETAKESILKIASGQGYEEGLNRAKQEESRITAELEAEKRKVQEEYERRVSELEPAFVEIVKELVRKLTGIAYENHTEVLTYLVEQGLAASEKDTAFTVLLHPEDLERIRDLVPQLQEKYQDKLKLEFRPEESLKPGDCILENENRRLDCSLGTQREGLLDALSMLSAPEGENE